jgi:hypothetical protein
MKNITCLFSIILVFIFNSCTNPEPGQVKIKDGILHQGKVKIVFI